MDVFGVTCRPAQMDANRSFVRYKCLTCVVCAERASFLASRSSFEWPGKLSRLQNLVKPGKQWEVWQRDAKGQGTLRHCLPGRSSSKTANIHPHIHSNSFYVLPPSQQSSQTVPFGASTIAIGKHRETWNRVLAPKSSHIETKELLNTCCFSFMPVNPLNMLDMLQDASRPANRWHSQPSRHNSTKEPQSVTGHCFFEQANYLAVLTLPFGFITVCSNPEGPRAGPLSPREWRSSSMVLSKVKKS